MALDPRQLRAFLTIVRSGSLGLAAETLHVTQPALSRIIRRLEMQLGVQLFERRSTGMELTSFGQALLPHAMVLSEEAALAIAQINSLRGLGHGTVRIGAIGGPIPESADIVQVGEQKVGDRYAVISSATHPFQERARVTLAEIMTVP